MTYLTVKEPFFRESFWKSNKKDWRYSWKASKVLTKCVHRSTIKSICDLFWKYFLAVEDKAKLEKNKYLEAEINRDNLVYPKKFFTMKKCKSFQKF